MCEINTFFLVDIMMNLYLYIHTLITINLSLVYIMLSVIKIHAFEKLNALTKCKGVEREKHLKYDRVEQSKWRRREVKLRRRKER